MSRFAVSRCVAAALALLATPAVTLPAHAFWERSQWSRCSDASTVAEWNRHLCWQLDPYHDGIGHRGYGGASGGYLDELYPHGRMRRGGGVVQRLG